MKIRTVLAHHGGKWSMAEEIIKRFPPHRIYVEPFCGSCSVLLQKPKSFVEIVNDRDDTIVSIFRALREHPLELATKLWAVPYAKRNWAEAPRDRLEEAALAIAQAQQFYLGAQKTSTFVVDATAAAHKPKSDVWAEWHERVFPAAARLKTVQILCEDAVEVVKRFGQEPEALLYVDPPYIGHEDEYRHQVNYADLVDACRDAKAKIVVSESTEGALRWPAEWRREVLIRTGRSGAGRHKKSKKNEEYLIFNFGPTAANEVEGRE